MVKLILLGLKISYINISLSISKPDILHIISFSETVSSVFGTVRELKGIITIVKAKFINVISVLSPASYNYHGRKEYH